MSQQSNELSYREDSEDERSSNEEELLAEEHERPRLMTEKEESAMLYSINILPKDENLLDLSCEQMSKEGQGENKGFRQWEYMEDREVEVSSPITISDGYITSYKLYKIKTKKVGASDFETIVERRYSDFQYLHEQLIDKYSGWLIPKLPDKNFWASLDMETSLCRDSRKKGLQRYLTRLLAHSKIRYLPELKLFLFDSQQEFSQNKGLFSAQRTYEQKIIKQASGYYETGMAILGKYVMRESYEELEPFKLPITKEDNEILHFQAITSHLANTIRDIKIIVDNTLEEANTITDLSFICQELTKVPSPFCEIQTDHRALMAEYEDLFELIISCKEALDRRSALRKQLENLKIEQSILQAKNRNNPRSMSLDIIRAEIQNTNRRYSTCTKQLLGQLESQINLGRSLLSQFMINLKQARSEIYQHLE